MRKTLFTFPGKLGDLLYTLPIIRAYEEKFKIRPSIQTSKYCTAAVPLLRSQGYEVLIDSEYECLSELCGMQPAEMNEPEGYDQIFHLGFRRDIIGSPIGYPHIIYAFAATMKKRHSIDLKWNTKEPYINLYKKPEKTKLIVANCYGDSLSRALRNTPVVKELLKNLWEYLAEYFSSDILFITGPKDKEYYSFLESAIYIPEDLLNAALTINNAAAFIGVPSCPYVIADALKIPRLVFGIFKHVYPTDPTGQIFLLGEKPQAIAKKLEGMIKDSNIIKAASTT